MTHSPPYIVCLNKLLQVVMFYLCFVALVHECNMSCSVFHKAACTITGDVSTPHIRSENCKYNYADAERQVWAIVSRTADILLGTQFDCCVF